MRGSLAELAAEATTARNCGVHHAGTNGRQRGRSRREDALDTVIAFRRPEDYSPEHGARFEVHFEKLRNRVDGDAAVPFEAKLAATSTDETGVRWTPLRLTSARAEASRAAFQRWTFSPGGRRTLRVSKTEAGRLRLRAVADGLLVSGHGDDRVRANGHDPASWIAADQLSAI